MRGSQVPWPLRPNLSSFFRPSHVGRLSIFQLFFYAVEIDGKAKVLGII